MRRRPPHLLPPPPSVWASFCRSVRFDVMMMWRLARRQQQPWAQSEALSVAPAAELAFCILHCWSGPGVKRTGTGRPQH